MFIFFVSFFSHPVLVLLLLGLMILNEWEWMEVVCWRMKMKMKMNEISFENEQISWTSIFFFFFQRGREMRFSLVIPFYTTFFEWHFREQEHLKRENGNEMEKYLLLVNRQCFQMNLFHNERCFQWDLECLIKSNQIKSNHTFQYHISHTLVNTLLISLNLSEWRKI